MDSFLPDILSNVLANIIFWLGGGVFVGLLLSRRRRKLNRFFGIIRGKPMLVYLSSISKVYKHGEEVTIPEYEIQLIPVISRLFTSRSIPDMFAGLIDTFWLIKQPPIEFKSSPSAVEEIEFSSTICLGGPDYNAATVFYSLTCSPYLSFVKPSGSTDWCIKITRGVRAGQVVKGESGWDLGLINRVQDVEHGNLIFIVAGLGTNGTRAAGEYLVKNWLTLLKMYGGKDFGICIRCPHIGKDSKGYQRPEVVLQLPH